MSKLNIFFIIVAFDDDENVEVTEEHTDLDLTISTA